MAQASRILLLFTTAHCYTPSNRLSFYEIYTNLPIVIGSEPAYEKDTPAPYCSATVSPLDPQLFSSAREHADELLGRTRSARYSPVEVAAWMERWAGDAAAALKQARVAVGGRPGPAFRRWEEDILIQIGLGRFFADRFRATMLYELYLRTGDAAAGEQAIIRYQAARDAWATMADRAKTVYQPDISYGAPEFERLHWASRTAAFDRDLRAMRDAVAHGSDSRPSHDPVVRAAVAAATAVTPRWSVDCHHVAPERFRAGSRLAVELDAAEAVRAVELCFRHVNHGERWRSVSMAREGTRFSADIPGEYTRSPYPLQYYFVLHGKAAGPVFFPSFNETLSNQPYFAVWQRA